MIKYYYVNFFSIYINNMVNYLNSLSKKYDKDIRKECETKRLLYINCLNNNFNDVFICKNYIKEFDSCIKNFDTKFK